MGDYNLNNHSLTVTAVSLRNVNTKAGPKAIKALTVAELPGATIDLWDSDPAFAIQPGQFLVATGLIYSKKNNPNKFQFKMGAYTLISNQPGKPFVAEEAPPYLPQPQPNQIPQTAPVQTQPQQSKQSESVILLREISQTLKQILETLKNPKQSVVDSALGINPADYEDLDGLEDEAGY